MTTDELVKIKTRELAQVLKDRRQQFGEDKRSKLKKNWRQLAKPFKGDNMINPHPRKHPHHYKTPDPDNIELGDHYIHRGNRETYEVVDITDDNVYFLSHREETYFINKNDLNNFRKTIRPSHTTWFIETTDEESEGKEEEPVHNVKRRKYGTVHKTEKREQLNDRPYKRKGTGRRTRHYNSIDVTVLDFLGK